MLPMVERRHDGSNKLYPVISEGYGCSYP